MFRQDYLNQIKVIGRALWKKAVNFRFTHNAGISWWDEGQILGKIVLRECNFNHCNLFIQSHFRRFPKVRNVNISLNISFRLSVRMKEPMHTGGILVNVWFKI